MNKLRRITPAFLLITALGSGLAGCSTPAPDPLMDEEGHDDRYTPHDGHITPEVDEKPVTCVNPRKLDCIIT